jgi:Zn-dependent protease
MNVSLAGIVIYFSIFIFAMMIHEIAHGWVAYKLGDPTAKFSGRLTLNPISHIDPIGTILLPITLIMMGSPVVFGWAKPVPINFMGLRNPKKDIMWVGAAGPLANVIFAFILAAVLRLSGIGYTSGLGQILFYGTSVNLILAAFNLIPIPPLDGSRVVFRFLPPDLAMRYMSIEPYGFIIVFVLLWLGFLNWFVMPMVAVLEKIIGI